MIQSARPVRYDIDIVPFTAGDGFGCNLLHATNSTPKTRGAVLLVHGAGVRANIFQAPVETTIVDYLLARGWDVWLENWRASIEFAPNQWTLDTVALYDHPQAVKTVAEKTGSDKISALIHCQGSTSFMMSVVAGLVPQVKTVVTNAVSLHPVVPVLSGKKLRYALPILKLMTNYLNPHWGLERPTLVSKFVHSMVELFHHECDNPVCKEVSFTYGSGFPALWSHANLNDATHEWLKQEFNAVPMSFFSQMARCVRAGHLVSIDGKGKLPENFVAGEPQTDARFAFFAGADNLCFLPQSQTATYDFFRRYRKDFHSLYVVPGYGHLDMFMGRNAAQDVFPLMAAELEKNVA